MRTQPSWSPASVIRLGHPHDYRPTPVQIDTHDLPAVVLCLHGGASSTVRISEHPAGTYEERGPAAANPAMIFGHGNTPCAPKEGIGDEGDHSKHRACGSGPKVQVQLCALDDVGQLRPASSASWSGVNCSRPLLSGPRL
jgi:hypothetical protein